MNSRLIAIGVLIVLVVGIFILLAWVNNWTDTIRISDDFMQILLVVIVPLGLLIGGFFGNFKN